MPRRARCTRPWRSWGRSALIVLIGTAKPIPILLSPPSPARMALLIPITEPWTRAVGQRISADDFRGVGLPFVTEQSHANLFRSGDDVIVRENLPITADDESGPKRPLRLLARHPRGAKEA